MDAVKNALHIKEEPFPYKPKRSQNFRHPGIFIEVNSKIIEIYIFLNSRIKKAQIQTLFNVKKKLRKSINQL